MPTPGYTISVLGEEIRYFPVMQLGLMRKQLREEREVKEICRLQQLYGDRYQPRRCQKYEDTKVVDAGKIRIKGKWYRLTQLD